MSDKPGYRLRLDIASAAFPEYSRNLNTGETSELGTGSTVAHQTLYRGPEHPSHLLLPVIDPSLYTWPATDETGPP